MKKILLALTNIALMYTYSLGGMMQETRANAIFEKIKFQMQHRENPINIEDDIELNLTQAGKDALLKKIFEYQGSLGSSIYQHKRPYFEILVQNGANVNAQFGGLFPETLLNQAVHHEDEEMVKLLLDRQASITKTDPLLKQVKTVSLAKLLVEHGALEPYTRPMPVSKRSFFSRPKTNEPSPQHSLFSKIMGAHYEPGLIDFYKMAFNNAGNNVDFTEVDAQKNTLMHDLCFAAQGHTVPAFKIKLETLKHYGVPMQTRNKNGQLPIDIIHSTLRDRPHDETLQFARQKFTELQNQGERL